MIELWSSNAIVLALIEELAETNPSKPRYIRDAILLRQVFHGLIPMDVPKGEAKDIKGVNNKVAVLVYIMLAWWKGGSLARDGRLQADPS
jgi:hypothetical protein